MKNLLLLLALAISITACASVKTHYLDCKLDKDKIIKEIASIMIIENYSLVNSNSEIGYYVFKNDITTWEIQLQENKLIIHTYQGSKDNFPIYYNNDTRKEATVYWNVRNKLESICKNIFVIVDEEKENEKAENDKIE
jgi:hypothetical protein